MQNIICRADPDLGAQEEDPWDWNVAENAAQATKKPCMKGADPFYKVLMCQSVTCTLAYWCTNIARLTSAMLFMPAHHAVGSRVRLYSLDPQTLLTSPIHGGLRTAKVTCMTISYDHAASKAKTLENDAVPPNKKAKKLNSTKLPSKPVKAIKQEGADNNAGAFPDLTNAPTHGPDEPLLLEHGSTHEGD